MSGVHTGTRAGEGPGAARTLEGAPGPRCLGRPRPRSRPVAATGRTGSCGLGPAEALPEGRGVGNGPHCCLSRDREAERSGRGRGFLRSRSASSHGPVALPQQPQDTGAEGQEGRTLGYQAGGAARECGVQDLWKSACPPSPNPRLPTSGHCLLLQEAFQACPIATTWAPCVLSCPVRGGGRRSAAGACREDSSPGEGAGRKPTRSRNVATSAVWGLPGGPPRNLPCPADRGTDARGRGA